jgi:hypothetical protein
MKDEKKRVRIPIRPSVDPVAPMTEQDVAAP